MSFTHEPFPNAPVEKDQLGDDPLLEGLSIKSNVPYSGFGEAALGPFVAKPTTGARKAPRELSAEHIAEAKVRAEARDAERAAAVAALQAARAQAPQTETIGNVSLHRGVPNARTQAAEAAQQSSQSERPLIITGDNVHIQNIAGGRIYPPQV